MRDATFDEDRAQIHTRNGPQIMTSLRNLAITVLRLTGVTNITAALHPQARQPDQPPHTSRPANHDFADALGGGWP